MVAKDMKGSTITEINLFWADCKRWAVIRKCSQNYKVRTIIRRQTILDVDIHDLCTHLYKNTARRLSRLELRRFMLLVTGLSEVLRRKSEYLYADIWQLVKSLTAKSSSDLLNEKVLGRRKKYDKHTIETHFLVDEIGGLSLEDNKEITKPTSQRAKRLTLDERKTSVCSCIADLGSVNYEVSSTPQRMTSANNIKPEFDDKLWKFVVPDENKDNIPLGQDSMEYISDLCLKQSRVDIIVDPTFLAKKQMELLTKQKSLNEYSATELQFANQSHSGHTHKPSISLLSGTSIVDSRPRTGVGSQMHSTPLPSSRSKNDMLSTGAQFEAYANDIMDMTNNDSNTQRIIARKRRRMAVRDKGKIIIDKSMITSQNQLYRQKKLKLAIDSYPSAQCLMKNLAVNACSIARYHQYEKIKNNGLVNQHMMLPEKFRPIDCLHSTTAPGDYRAAVNQTENFDKSNRLSGDYSQIGIMDNMESSSMIPPIPPTRRAESTKLGDFNDVELPSLLDLGRISSSTGYNRFKLPIPEDPETDINFTIPNAGCNFSSIVQNADRKSVALAFRRLLDHAATGDIELSQDTPFGQIMIRLSDRTLRELNTHGINKPFLIENVSTSQCSFFR